VNLPDKIPEPLQRLVDSTLTDPAKPCMTWPIMSGGEQIGWSGSYYDAARHLAAEVLSLRADLAQARADLAAAQATVTAVAKVMAQLRGGALDAEAWGEDLAAPANGGLLARMVAKMREDLEAAQDRLTWPRWMAA